MKSIWSNTGLPHQNLDSKFLEANVILSIQNDQYILGYPVKVSLHIGI